jgi:hypothetical protein
MGWPASEVTQEQLQNLVCQWYITTVELATYRVLEHPASPTLAGGGIHCGVCGIL